LIGAIRIRDGAKLGGRLLVAGGNGSADNDGPRGVFNDSSDTACSFLSRENSQAQNSQK
jgi:hypothetical protein